VDIVSPPCGESVPGRCDTPAAVPAVDVIGKAVVTEDEDWNF